jgi:hypothetical protein
MNIDGQNTLACTKSMHDVKRRRGQVNPLPHQPCEGPGARTSPISTRNMLRSSRG